MTDISSKLVELGLSDKEAKTYLSALELGPSTILDISKNSKVNRATTYYIISELIDKGLMNQMNQGKKVIYSATDAQALMSLLKRREDVLSSILPELAIYQSKSVSKPKITFFEGEMGFIRGLSDYLDAKNEVLIFSSDISFSQLLDQSPEVIKARVQKKIFAKIIAPKSSLFENQKRFDKERFREMRFFPPNKYPFSNQIHIYNNKLAILSYKDKIALIIESADIAQSWRSIFNFCWDTLEKEIVK